MKRFKFIEAIVALMSFFVIFAAGCFTGNSGGGTSDNSSNNSSNSGNTANGDNQEEEEPPAPEFESGSGAESDPYIITQPYQWTNINNHLAAYYQLGADLNMGDIKDLKPVGSDASPFTGYLDGKNHKIHSATLKSALFGTISGGTVKNLNFADSEIPYADASLASIVKMGALIENCHVTSITMPSTEYQIVCGGLINTVASASTVRYCSANVTISMISINCAVPLIAGVSGGHVDCCWVTGSISGGESSGLLYRLTGGTVTNCYSQFTRIDGKATYNFGYNHSGGEISYCLNIADWDATIELDQFYHSSVEESPTLKRFGPSTIENSNDLLDTDGWKDNKLWKKGKLHPELVSYEEYLQITAEN